MTILGLEFDRGAWYLVAVNLFAAGTALYAGMAIGDLLLVYWAHSVLIGIGTLVRILRLRDFSVKGKSGWSEASPEERSAEKRQSAAHFALFYLIFSIACLAAIFMSMSPTAMEKSPIAFYACVAVFALQYGWDLVQSMRADAAGRPDLDDPLLLPGVTLATLFIVCMITGPAMKGGAGPAGLLGLALLTFYKTCADVTVHCVERDRNRRDGDPYIS